MNPFKKLFVIMVGFFKRLGHYEPDVTFRTKEGVRYTVAEPEAFLATRDPFNIQMVERLREDVYGRSYRTREYISWTDKRPEELIPVRVK